jgi:hypothetical protein
MPRAVVLFLGLFATLYLAARLFCADPPIIDSEQSAFTWDHEPQTIYLSDNQQIVLGRRHLASRSPKVLLLGSSNAQEGLRPPLLAPYVPGWEVHNLSISASNVTEAGQIVSLVDEVLPPAAPTVVVLGIWYGLFMDNQTRWKEHRSHVASEARRIDLYRDRDGTLERRVPLVLFDAATELLRPQLLIEGATRHLEHRTTCALFGERCIGVRDRETMKSDAAQKASMLRDWMETMGPPPLTDEQFLVLDQLARSLMLRGRKLLLVDLPVPRWHAAASPHLADYQGRKRRFLDPLIAAGASYLDLQSLDEEDDFYDLAHPRPSRTHRWNEPVGERLRTLVQR